MRRRLINSVRMPKAVISCAAGPGMTPLRFGKTLLWRGLVNRVHQLTRKNRFLQIGNATCPEGLPARGRVIKGRHEDDRKG